MPSRVALVCTAALCALAAATSACSQPAPRPTEAKPTEEKTANLVKSGDVVVFGDWKADAPGVRHKIALDDLPAPTAGAANPSNTVPPPPNALPKVPDGFSVAVFASGLESPRAMTVAPNGDIFVSEQTAGRVRVIRAVADGSKPGENSSFTDGLDQPFGIAFYPAGASPQWVYVAENNRVVRYPYQSGDLKARGAAQVIIPEISPSTGGHWTRDIVFSPDGKQLFLSVGSNGNIAENMPKKSPAEIQDWEAKHGLGAAWDIDVNRADVLVSDPDGKGLHPYATGIRNCSGLTLQQQTGEIWCSTNERDMLGDNLVPDYITHVEQGHFYGWPWYYIGDHVDARMSKSARPDLKGKVTVPDLLIQAHSAAVEIAFYDAASGANLFPAEYRGDAFVALHGSWNRKTRTGYKVVLAPMKDGKTTGEYVDFMTGFVANDADVWGRPYGLAVLHDGSLLVGDDSNGIIYRVTPKK
jgi:glucose/arabinose dehydrogenase